MTRCIFLVGGAFPDHPVCWAGFINCMPHNLLGRVIIYSIVMPRDVIFSATEKSISEANSTVDCQDH